MENQTPDEPEDSVPLTEEEFKRQMGWPFQRPYERQDDGER